MPAERPSISEVCRSIQDQEIGACIGIVIWAEERLTKKGRDYSELRALIVKDLRERIKQRAKNEV